MVASVHPAENKMTHVVGSFTHYKAEKKEELLESHSFKESSGVDEPPWAKGFFDALDGFVDWSLKWKKLVMDIYNAQPEQREQMVEKMLKEFGIEDAMRRTAWNKIVDAVDGSSSLLGSILQNELRALYSEGVCAIQAAFSTFNKWNQLFYDTRDANAVYDDVKKYVDSGKLQEILDRFTKLAEKVADKAIHIFTPPPDHPGSTPTRKKGHDPTSMFPKEEGLFDDTYPLIEQFKKDLKDIQRYSEEALEFFERMQEMGKRGHFTEEERASLMKEAEELLDKLRAATQSAFEWQKQHPLLVPHIRQMMIESGSVIRGPSYYNLFETQVIESYLYYIKVDALGKNIPDARLIELVDGILEKVEPRVDMVREKIGSWLLSKDFTEIPDHPGSTS